MIAEELGERVLAALVDENSGNKYHRVNVIRDKGIEAIFQAAEIPIQICGFRNKYGWCKLADGHKGSHTVIWLGDD